MALSAGTRLGPYEILAPLGAGGMGEVYRATDTKLGREVAIKTLPTEVTGDAERLARFQREAHLLASLNHPHIAAIYGLEEADGKPFLVLELVEGEDLAERLKRGAIPVDEALEIAKQIAEGLEEAHEKGIIHRDLKPANVKVTPDGKVKVLDFGLAKAWEGDPVTGSSSDLSQAPTLEHSGTQAGVILGTAAYMSPEQARGKPTDKRADIWAFGVVVFEMLTGQPLFTGETVSDILAAVMRDDPDWSTLPAPSPPSLRRLLRRCLQKAPRERLHDIADVRLELGDVLKGGAEDAGHPERDEHLAAVERERRARQGWVWAVGGLVIGGLAAGLVFTGLTEDPAAPPAVHLVHTTPAGSHSAALFGRQPVPSPDGRHVAFLGAGQLWIRSLDSLEARPLPGTEGGYLVFWSPDSASLAFFTGSELSKVRLDDGSVQRICALPPGAQRGGTWGHDGTIVFSGGGQRGSLFAVAAGGGDARPFTTLDDSRGETSHFWPQFLPAGRQLLFVVQSTQDESEGLHVASLDAPHERRRLLPGRARVAYSSGHLLFVRDAILLAQPFDAGSLEVSGEPAPVVQNVASWGGRPDWGWFGVSPSGVLAYLDATARASSSCGSTEGESGSGPAGSQDRTARSCCHRMDGVWPSVAGAAKEQRSGSWTSPAG